MFWLVLLKVKLLARRFILSSRSQAILELRQKMLIFSVICVVFTQEELILLWWILPRSGKSHKMSFLAKGKQALFHNIFDCLKWLARNTCTSQTYRLIYISCQNILNTLVWAACGKAQKDKRVCQKESFINKVALLNE